MASEIIATVFKDTKPEGPSKPVGKPVDAISLEKLEERKSIKLGKKFNLVPAPNADKRSTFLISGKSGSGKSYLANQIAGLWKKLNPDGEMYLITLKPPEENSSLDVEQFINLPINEEFVLQKLTPAHFPNDCLILFDDFDSIVDKKQRKAVYGLIDNCLRVGREHGISVILTNHQLNEGMKTRNFIHECSRICIFPKVTPAHFLNSFCTRYLGLPKSEIEVMKKLDTRWVCISPADQFILYQKGAYMM